MSEKNNPDIPRKIIRIEAMVIDLDLTEAVAAIGKTGGNEEAGETGRGSIFTPQELQNFASSDFSRFPQFSQNFVILNYYPHYVILWFRRKIQLRLSIVIRNI